MTALILLPGMDGTGTLFADLVSVLPPDLRPVVVAYQVHRPLNYAELTQFVSAQLPSNEPYILLGESFSGPVAISLAAKRPGGLAGLVLCATFAKNPRPELAPLRPLLGILPFPSWLLSLVAPFLLSSNRDKRLMRELRNAAACVDARVWRARLRAVLDVDVSTELRSIEVPILYLQAADDRLVPSSAARFIADQVPSVEVLQIDGPHLLLQTQPRASAAAISAFMRQIPA
ncbi:alpha/beta fold hydrolase [Pseudoduganella sp. RAF53_2]|uniref:alpha/beta fold hydrolase n=1 Tax=unclassified Pseudoduganella TaxID=2637179 RepID=UPI003F98CB00